MKFAKLFLVGLAALALIGLVLSQTLLKDPIAFARVGTAYAAKQVCSCRFVSDREMASCKADFTQDLSQIKLTESYITATGRTDQSVTASAAFGLISATATYEPGLGCAHKR